ncbi:DUF4167 domain-containing protein [Chelativorans salis]|uniref:DUF4167 domain-containing protein n=1 Tax=Chelativorans salis TaxID=2978478 RepID=A0ABT2LTU4_9HYPH|nr:DUF4167 domain-containing protein [Chelativorans sp. EGI FJ00035]MCT7377489.1 DUF4167 domain-containing protein [Chelativorans sp. EGI FJ00035]
MRPQQQNRRMRGRGNNNRKGPNPLTRSYESNGPDVKIRGTAQQVADKYTTLARDAQSSGDRVMAENYLQHAEHYNRLIAAAQAQQQPQQNMRDNREDDDEREDRDEQEPSRSEAQPQPRQRQRVDDGSGPQPVIDGIPAEVALDRQGNGANRAKSNGHADGNEEDAAPKETEAASEEGAEAPKPAKRPRRPRKKAAETSDADEKQPAEEAAAQG